MIAEDERFGDKDGGSGCLEMDIATSSGRRERGECHVSSWPRCGGLAGEDSDLVQRSERPKECTCDGLATGGFS